MKQKANESTFQTFFRYLIPSMLSLTLYSMFIFIDSFVVGHAVGSVALGAMGSCTPVVTLTYAVGFMFGVGGGALYAIEMGRGNPEKANQYCSTAALIMVCVGVTLAIICNIWLDPLAKALGASPENIGYAKSYLRCILCYMPGFMLDTFSMSLVRNDQHPNVTMIAVVIGTLTNIGLDLLFVFGFHWGMSGAALATCIGSGTCAVCDIGYAYIKKLNIRFRIKNVCMKLLQKILGMGISVFVLESSSAIITIIFVNRAVALYGTTGATIYAIIMNWTLICYNLFFGITEAVQPLASLNYGQGNHKNVRAFLKYGMISVIIGGAVFLLIGYGCTSGLVRIFETDNLALIPEAVSCFRLYLPTLGLMGISILTGTFYQAVEEARMAFVILFMRGILLPAAGLILLSLIFGKTGLWIAVPIGELITVIVSLISLGRKKYL